MKLVWWNLGILAVYSGLHHIELVVKERMSGTPATRTRTIEARVLVPEGNCGRETQNSLARNMTDGE
jgi:hypothetical protein